MGARTVVICDRGQLSALFNLLDHTAVTVTKVLTNVLRPARFRWGGDELPCFPACDIDRLEATEADLCILLRSVRNDDVDARLAARGFGPGRVLDLDAPMFFRDGPRLSTALDLVRQGQIRWRGVLTGLSYYRAGILSQSFDHQLLNLAGDSQDLHYDLALLRAALQSPQQFEYAVLGLAPYSLDYDLALSGEAWRFIKYAPALGDDHGVTAPLPLGYAEIFDGRIAARRADDADAVRQDTFDSLFTVSRAEYFTLASTFAGRSKAEKWARRSYPATRATNSDHIGRYVDLCRATGIKVFIILPPLSGLFRGALPSAKHADMLSRVKLECDKGGVHFRDFSAFTEEVGHYYDSDHLNTAGAGAFSAELRRWIDGELAA